LARLGQNTLLVQVQNDYIMLGNNADKGFLPGAERRQGDKIYAAVGPGWDNPEVGWTGCPPGMGIYQDAWIEARNRVHIHDIFVHPLSGEGQAEAWVEVFNCDPGSMNVALDLSVFGQNFPDTNYHARIQNLPGIPLLEVIAGRKLFQDSAGPYPPAPLGARRALALPAPR